MEDIIEWLNGPKNYLQGVHLYELFGGYPSVVSLLRIHTDPNKLTQVMRDLLAKLQAQPSKVEVPVQSIEKDDYLIKIDKVWHKLYAEMSTYHARIAAVSTDEERYALAEKVITHEGLCAKEWAKRDYYMEHDKPMPADKKTKKKVQIVDMTANDHRKLTNERTYLSINRRELRSLEADLSIVTDSIKRATIISKIGKKQEQIEKREQTIKSMENGTTSN